jgi:flavin-dependent dehydrogenase
LNLLPSYDIVVAGGGLAGLTLSIQLAAKGYSVALMEKNRYPFHRVCGEYISNESKDFLARCGLNFDHLQLPQIKRLQVSSPSGQLMEHDLELGGFGISRYSLDSQLADIARNRGVALFEGCKVIDINFRDDGFEVISDLGTCNAKVVAGTWGKKSGLDNKLGRKTFRGQRNYVGIKYHVKVDHPSELIGLHNFRNGYCGISKIEDEKYCMCYLSDSSNLKDHKGDIKKMEQKVLISNPYLRRYFNEATFIFDEPVAISNIQIGARSAVHQHVLMAGDAAGNIAPLSGNGMSMAMRSAFSLSVLIHEFLQKEISRDDLEKQYTTSWQSRFRSRIEFSRVLQTLLKNTALTDVTISALRRMPGLRGRIVRSTHGKPF